jgi:hypothetical protein
MLIPAATSPDGLEGPIISLPTQRHVLFWGGEMGISRVVMKSAATVIGITASEETTALQSYD